MYSIQKFTDTCWDLHIPQTALESWSFTCGLLSGTLTGKAYEGECVSLGVCAWWGSVDDTLLAENGPLKFQIGGFKWKVWKLSIIYLSIYEWFLKVTGIYLGVNSNSITQIINGLISVAYNLAEIHTISLDFLSGWLFNFSWC